MKRFITCAICILSLNIVNAGTPPAVDTTTYVNVDVSSLPQKYNDTTVAPVSQLLPGYYQNSIFKLRLDSIQKDIPLEYNEYVQNYIDIYTRHKDEMSHVLGLAKYYFPIYEKAFHEAGIPEEIKYLSIVESKLDPTAVSRVGATGPWQFMSATAKAYGLNMDNYIDERRDPIQASYAAAAYLKDAYMEFGDWLLAIASYNCGKSNVERAIQKAGAVDFWSIRQFLPLETRNYVPAYIAVAYVMNYANKHSIFTQPWNLSASTDIILVDRFVSLSNISKILNISIRELSMLNPAYKKQIINGTTAAPQRLVIPKPAQEYYAALYDALNTDTVQPTVANASDRYEKKITGFHKVKRGETLADIADSYGVDLQDLKDWNNLRNNKAVAGKKLWLNDGHESSNESSSSKSESKFITYKVKRGDTLRVIAGKFDGNSPESIRALNGLKKGALQPGMMLKISHG
ncbi:MAG: lytic transglycosylase [Mucilaginibacter sp.]|nr:lytic transglycosylase [Mucilaginibacter sp.]